MKPLLLFIVLGLAVLTSASRATAEKSSPSVRLWTETSAYSALQRDAYARVFNLKQYGAKGDNSTNDAAALKLAVTAVNAAGGGTLFIPDGTYLLTYGNPTTDPNLFAPNGSTYTAIWVNTDKFKIQMTPHARLRVQVSYLATGTCCPDPWGWHTYMIHFGDGATAKKYFEWDGGSGSVTFEVTGGATIENGINNSNDWPFYGGMSRYNYQHDLFIDGFPAGGLLAGESVAYHGETKSIVDAVLERYYVLNYGGCGHCNWAYLHGNVTVREFSISSSRTDQSHGWYWGANTPGITIEQGVINGVGANPADNSFGIQVYRESGADTPEGFTIRKVKFTNTPRPIYIQQFGGYESKRFLIEDNEMVIASATSTGIQMFTPADGIIRGNHMRGFGTTVQIVSPSYGRNLLVDGNHFDGCGGSAMRLNYSTISNNMVNGGLSGSATRILVDGIGNRIIGNQIVNGGSSPSGGTGIGVVGDGNTISHNYINSSNGFGYLNIVSCSSCTNTKIIDNTFAATVTGTNGAYLFTGSGYDIRGNYWGNTPIIQGSGSAGNNVFSHNSVITGSSQSPQITGTTVKTVVTGNILPSGWRTPVSTEITGVIQGYGNYLAAGLDTLVSSTTPLAVHAGGYRNVVFTLTGNTTFDAPLNPTVGDVLNFTLIQDGTGGRTTTWNSVFKVSCALTTTASTKTGISFRYDGTHWVQQGACVTGL